MDNWRKILAWRLEPPTPAEPDFEDRFIEQVFNAVKVKAPQMHRGYFDRLYYLVTDEGQEVYTFSTVLDFVAGGKSLLLQHVTLGILDLYEPMENEEFNE